MAAMEALCLLFVCERKDSNRNIAPIVGIGAFAYAIVAPFLSPSLMQAVSGAANDYEKWSMGSVTALAIVALGGTILLHYLKCGTADWRVQFFSLFAYFTSSIPIIFTYLHLPFVSPAGPLQSQVEFAMVP